ncbi:RNA-directed DNA polymerase, eukaryota, reverse transcriptase zinc-binding domain protein [Tanacetum coccineum]
MKKRLSGFWYGKKKSKRQLKIPTHFADSIHNLNGKSYKKKNVCNNKKVDDSMGYLDSDLEYCDADKGCLDSEVEEQNDQIKASNDVACGDKDRVDQGRGDRSVGDENIVVNEVVVEEEQLVNDPVKLNVSTPYDSNKDHHGSADKKSYAYATSKLIHLVDNKLNEIPTKTDENGNEFVIFNDEMVKDGSRKWQFTLCGYFKWDINVSIDKTEPDKLPLWMRLCNVPLEAWTNKGISALASRIGKPLIMAARTAEMYKLGVGRIGYARVLVESNKETVVEEGFIEVVHKKNANQNGGFQQPFQNIHQIYHQQRNYIRNGGVKQNTKNVYKQKVVNRGQRNDKGSSSVNGNVRGSPTIGSRNDGDKSNAKNKAKSTTASYDMRNVNKFSVLGELEEGELVNKQGLNGKERVDVFINMKKRPFVEESVDWTQEMILYFKQKRELMIDKDSQNVNGVVVGEVEDVYEEFEGIANIYAANGGFERRELWKDLNRHKVITGDHPWAIGGDFNVTLAAEEHSTGSSAIPALLIIPDGVKKKKKSFKFANYLTDKDDFLKVVEENWSLNVEGYNMYSLTKKMKTLKIPLNNLNRSYGNLVEKVQDLKNKLKMVQSAIDLDPSDKNLRDIESDTLKTYMEAMSDEEKLLYQKSKIKWLSYGDKNNAFFHKILKGRYQRNRISVIHNEMGQRFEGNQVASQFVDHFTKFLGSNVHVLPIPDDDLMFKRRLPMLEAGNIVKEAWNIVGSDVCKAIKEFFYSGKLLGELNATVISLIPKMQTPLKSAFIPERQIQDNILLAQELMKGYDRSGGPKRVAFKIDIQKAYDTVNWDFLEQLLRKFSFHEKMIQWIMVCIRYVKFSINVNGENCGFFKGGRGLRQGDPMSPYLFTMVMEFFTLIMERNVETTPEFNYHFGCRRLEVTHICFVDDLLVFCHDDPSSVRLIKSSLEEFGSHSGLVPNFSKSTVFFGSINNEDQQCLLDILPFQKGSLPMRYLGVFFITKRLGIKDCKALTDKIKDKVNNWRNKYLSYAGKLQLINTDVLVLCFPSS